MVDSSDIRQVTGRPAAWSCIKQIEHRSRPRNHSKSSLASGGQDPYQDSVSAGRQKENFCPSSLEALFKHGQSLLSMSLPEFLSSPIYNSRVDFRPFSGESKTFVPLFGCMISVSVIWKLLSSPSQCPYLSPTRVTVFGWLSWLPRLHPLCWASQTQPLTAQCEALPCEI